MQDRLCGSNPDRRRDGAIVVNIVVIVFVVVTIIRTVAIIHIVDRVAIEYIPRMMVVVRIISRCGNNPYCGKKTS